MRLNASQLYQYGQNHDCGECSSPIEVHNEQTLGVVCASCGTLHVITQSLVYPTQFKVEGVHQNKFAKKGDASIKAGTKFSLKGIVYTVVGVLGKSESNHSEIWFEYYLYNAQEGYRFLTEYNGHWIFLKEIVSTTNLASSGKSELVHEGDTYDFYNTYIAKNIRSAVGEFPIDLFAVAQTTVHEYICPPNMLTSETYQGKKTWFMGEYLPALELHDALGGEVTLPDQYGVGVLEPQPFRVKFNETMTISVFGIALAFLFSILFSNPKEVFRKDFDIASFSEFKVQYDSSRVYVSPSFVLGGGNQNLEFELSAQLNNGWLETDITLINDNTGNEYNFSIGAEFYSGVEDGEKWTEGSSDADHLLQKIPAGTYHIELVPSSTILFSPDFAAFPTFSLSITKGVKMFSGFWICLVLFSIFPIVCFIREQNFEHSRWQNSDYSPYEES